MTTRRDASKAIESIRKEYGDEQAFQLLIDAMLMLEAEIEDLDDELGLLQDFLETEGYEFVETDEVEDEEVQEDEDQDIPLNPFKVTKVKVTDCYQCVCEICGNDCSTCRFREERCKNCRK